jgi:hypothetical protein
LLSLCR